MPEVVWKRGAEEDLMSIFSDLEERREGAGEVFTRMLDGTLQGLRGHPQMAPVFGTAGAAAGGGQLGLWDFLHGRGAGHYRPRTHSPEPEPGNDPGENSPAARFEVRRGGIVNPARNIPLPISHSCNYLIPAKHPPYG